jgi:diaminohydroxyphosphoribosylaminopyrimidine deaminase/5-amino-6-(5-phosphoribosylamino)uracil reductase
MNDAIFMERCLELAKKGLGNTYPNPLVGSVIVHEGKVIGEGWHKKAGCNHAEREAISKVKDPSLLSNSTLYVNLEPCDHFGKTPPCTDLILEMKIPRVIIGCLDENKKVLGKGLKKLQAAGCEVEIGIL